MSRLQVLYLPTAGEVEPRYALVVDQAGDLAAADREALRVFASEAGAQGCLVLSGALDVDQGNDEEADEAVEAELTAELQRQFAAAMAPQQPRAPKLPPPHTTEGKLARIWGGKPPTEGDDPQ